MKIELNNNIVKQESNFEYFKRHWMLYLFLLPGMLLVFIFNYIPLPGLYISFLDYDYLLGFKSSFVGFQNFIEIFKIPEFSQSIINTLQISVLNLIIVFPIPIIFALMLNEISKGFFKRFVQTVSYLPHFLSWIAVIGITTSVLGSYGIVNDIRVAIWGEGVERTLYLTKQELFVPIVIILNIWKTLGWNSIIYLAAISGIDASLYEAAIIDGAGKFKQCIHITIPSILPTIVILFVLQIGRLFQSNFELIYGLQNVFINYEVISTMIYKQGITQGNYAISTAFGFMQGLIGMALVLLSNWVSKKVNNISII